VLLEELLTLLDITPVIADIHPVSLCFLPEGVVVLESAAEAAWLLDEPQPLLPQRILITGADPFYRTRFPSIRCNHNPFTPDLNRILFDRFDEVAARMLCQSEVAGRIAANAEHSDVIVLFLVDGLSYQDVRDWLALSDVPLTVEPCLVDGPTLTQVAFPNVIGDRPLAVRLFDLGFHNRLGFTYWTRQDNRLTERLFRTIPRVHKAGDFLEILTILRNYLGGMSGGKCYVQIVRAGLDGYAHGQKRKPPEDAIVAEVQQEFRMVGDLCQELSLRARLYLTADHGILWRDKFEPQVIGSAPGKSSPRWCDWRELYYQEDKGRCFLVDDEEYYCLGFPKLRRPLRIDEQGVHGGISYQESVVPFAKLEIMPTSVGGMEL
jgi:hypothetical protein